MHMFTVFLHALLPLSQNPYLYADFRLPAPKYTYTALEGGFESASTDVDRIVAIIIIANVQCHFDDESQACASAEYIFYDIQ